MIKLNKKIRILSLILCLFVFQSSFLSIPVHAENPVAVYVNGTELTFEQPPYIESNRTMVPLRAIFEALGAKVSWDGNTKTVKAVRENVEIELVINSKTAKKNNSEITLDSPAKIVNGYTFVPLRFVSEALGAYVTWEPQTRSVFVSMQERLGNTRVNAMENAKLAYENGWMYFNIKTDDKYLLYKQHKDSSDPELLLGTEVKCINVLDGRIYGSIPAENAAGMESGIYKISTQDGACQKLSPMTPHGLIVINNHIYFAEDKSPGIPKGVYSMNLDGSGLECIYQGNVDSFTIYSNTLILTLDGNLCTIGIDGTNFKRLFGEWFDAWHLFTVNEGTIYIHGSGVNPSTSKYEYGLYKIPVDGSNIEYLSDTNSCYNYDIRNGYIYFSELGEGLFRMKEDGTGYENLFYSDNIEAISLYDDLLYICIYDYYKESPEPELWYTDITASELIRISPLHDSKYNEVKALLEKTLSAMDEIDRYNTSITIYEDNLTDECTYTRKADIKVDKKNSIAFNHNELDYEIVDYLYKQSAQITYDRWLGSGALHTNENNSPMYEHRSFEGKAELQDEYPEFFEVYSFIDTGHDFAGSFDLSETQNEYILTATDSIKRIGSNLFKYTYFEDFFDDSYNFGAFQAEIHIGKSDYLIKSIKINYEEENTYLDSFKLRTEFSYTYPKDTLALSSQVQSSLSSFIQAERYVVLAVEANAKGEFNSAINYCNTALNTHTFACSAHIHKGAALYYLGSYDEAAEEYNSYLNKCRLNFNEDVYVLLAEVNIKLGYYTNAKYYIAKFSFDENNSLYQRALIAYGIALIETGSSDRALYYFDEVLKTEPKNTEAITGKIRALYNSGKYSECIDYCKKSSSIQPKSRSLWYYKGLSHLELYELDESIKSFKKALASPPVEGEIEDSEVYLYLCVIYYTIQDYDNAQVYIDRLSEIEGQEMVVMILQRLIDEGNRPQAEKVAEFVSENYLYGRDVSGFDKAVESFSSLGDSVNGEIVDNFISSIKTTDDAFTFVIHGDTFDYYMENTVEEDITYEKINEETEYIRIESFLTTTGGKFTSQISSIENPEEKTLVIDLRGNGGGVIYSAAEMLDVLLPSCTCCYLINRSGSTTEVYSYEGMIEFESIVILVDENSASASELFTLSLSKFLDNVTVIGRTTYGKGVGQTVYEDIKNEYVIYLVSFYWNVMEQNINKTGIKPDIFVEGTELSDFLNMIP